MNKKFIPELHDIGKLVDKDQIKNQLKKSWNGHVFVKFDFQNLGIQQPTSPSWWGQYHHWEKKICKKEKLSITSTIDIDLWDLILCDKNTIPADEKYHLFLLILADHLAASVSRATLEMGDKNKVHEGILKLWNKEYYNSQKKQGKYWAAFKTVNDLKILFNEIENCQSGEKFLNKYKDHLILTPEDKQIPRNVTSLYTHLELVGKIYRVLKKNTKLSYGQNCKKIVKFIEYKRIKVKNIKEAEGGKRTENGDVREGKWKARLVKCWVKFPHSIVRLRDVNLLRKREELVNHIFNNYKDEVIFTTSDFIILFLPLDQDVMEIFKPLLEWGFYVEVEETLADLGILNSILDRKTLLARKCVDKKYAGKNECLKKQKNFQEQNKVLNDRQTKVYRRYLMPEIPEELQPPICDICQQRRGVERIRENIREWVCERCQEVRSMGEPFKEYSAEWEKEGVKVCWFKFSLDQEKLIGWLQKAFEEYININIHNPKKADILKGEFRPLALQVDFNNDYKEMLEKFWDAFKEKEGKDIKKPIVGYNELGVFKYTPELAEQVIVKFLNLFDKYFPDCASDEDSPISLSLSVANIKYPIREHWRFFEDDSKNFLNVRYHNVFDEKYTRYELKNIIEKEIREKTATSFLYKLTQLEERIDSDIYLAVEIFNNRKKYPKIYDLFSMGIKPSKFLNLYRLLSGER